MPQEPSSQVITEGRIKQEAVRQGLPATRHWESAEEDSSGVSDDGSDEEPVAGDLADRWATVEPRHGRQAQEIARTLSNDVDHLIPPLVRNLHAHSSLWDVNAWNPPLTTRDMLVNYGKNVASALTKAGTLQSLAIDTSLVAAGWLADSAARPSRVMMLEDIADPGHSYAFTASPKVFVQATHVVVEPDWVHLHRLIPHPRSLFPALQYFCIQVDADSPSTGTIASFVQQVQQLLRVRRLEKLVVCMRSCCSRDAPVWKALKELSATEEKLRVLPHRCCVEREWKAMINGDSTVFNVSSVELQRRVAAMESQNSDLEASISAWRFKPPSMQVALSDAALDREFSPYVVDRLGTPWSDAQVTGIDHAPIAPGMQTAEEDLRDMMQRHVGSQLL